MPAPVPAAWIGKEGECQVCHGLSGNLVPGAAFCCTASQCKRNFREIKDRALGKSIEPRASKRASTLDGRELHKLKKVCGHRTFDVDQLDTLDFENGCAEDVEEFSYLVYGEWRSTTRKPDVGAHGHKWMTLRSILEALGDRKLAELEKYENEFGANLKKARQDMRSDMEAAETVSTV